MMIVYIAFPTLGKTYLSRKRNYVDLDRGFARKILGYHKLDSYNSWRIYRLMYKLLNYFKDEGYGVILTNDPEILDAPIRNVHFEFVIPSYDKHEFMRRIIDRGDDVNSEWVQDLYSNYEGYINEWRGIARHTGVSITEAWHLSDVIPSDLKTWSNVRKF